MATKLDVYNLALFKLGQSLTVASEAEQSVAAMTFNRLWPTTLEFVQCDAMWPWLTRTQALALSAQEPSPGWAYRYSRPNDCGTAWSISNQDGLTSYPYWHLWGDPQWRYRTFGPLYNWSTVYGENETEILAQVENAWLIYTVLDPNPARFPPTFVEALACKLALDAAGPIIGQAGLNNRSALLQEYEFHKGNAAAHDYNEGADQQWETTGAILARM